MTTDPLATLVAALERGGYDPRSTGPDAYESRCPAHNGSRHNLSINKGRDGQVLLNCHHNPGCDHKAIVESIGLTESDLFPGDPAPNGATKVNVNGKARKVHKTFHDAIGAIEWSLHQPRKGKADPTWKYQAHWVYQHATGANALAMVRFRNEAGEKEYRPFHGVEGGYVVGDPPGPLPLYRLPEVIDAARVYWAEGEKCADLIRDIGLVGTTTGHGAKSPGKTDVGPVAGKEVIILPDHDAPGEAYSRTVVGLLAPLEPRPTVRILRLPLANEGDDVAEWLASLPVTLGPDERRTELERLANEAPLEDLDAARIASEDEDEDDGAPVPPPRTGEAYELDSRLAQCQRTDLGNAERLAGRHGRDLRYCHPWRKWLVWDGRRWAIDTTAAARRRAKDAVRMMMAEAGTIANKKDRREHAKWAFKSEARERLNAMLDWATAEEEIPILPGAMDHDPWLFNCLNGTIDLRTGRLRPHRREDIITQLCPLEFDPSAVCPLWDSTLSLFLNGDQSLIDYWRRICGKAMAGVIRDHLMPIAYGNGANGKSTILGTLLEVYGPDYAMKCPPDMLMAKLTDSHPTDRADLFGKRLVVAIESESGRRLNETMVKELTGGDRIRARRMREDFWEFSPTHTLLMATNHKPMIRGTDMGIWRRLRLVPFTVTVKGDQADKAMPEKLRAEFPGILAWCVRGCLEWQKSGLQEPKTVADATAGYRKEQDTLGAFIEEHLIPAPAPGRVRAGEVYARYKHWAEVAGERFVLSLTAFGIAMQERGIEKATSGGVWYLGWMLRPFGGPREEGEL